MRNAIDRILAAEKEAKSQKEKAEGSAVAEARAAQERGKEYVREVNETAHKDSSVLIREAEKAAIQEQKQSKQKVKTEAEEIIRKADRKIEEAVEVIIEGIVDSL